MAYNIRQLKDSNDNPFYPRVVPESFDGEFSADNILIDTTLGFQSLTVNGALNELKNGVGQGLVHSTQLTKISIVSKSEYDSLSVKDSNTLYLIRG